VPKFHKQWTVLPHGRIEDVDEGILTVEGDIPMPLGKFPRRMTAIGLSGSRSVIFSAMALKEPDMRRLEALGTPSFLIVPNAHHRLDARIWKQRYPGLKVVSPPGAKDSAGEVTPVDATFGVFGDPSVELVTVAGTGEAEAALVVTRKGRTTLVVNDVIAHVRNPRGLGAKIMARLFGFGVHAPQVPRIVKRIMVKDRKALAGQFRAWADDPQLQRIIVSHGEIIDNDPAGALQSLAAKLDS
jgi:hypothetical protein